MNDTYQQDADDWRNAQEHYRECVSKLDAARAWLHDAERRMDSHWRGEILAADRRFREANKMRV